MAKGRTKNKKEKTEKLPFGKMRDLLIVSYFYIFHCMDRVKSKNKFFYDTSWSWLSMFF